MAERGDDNRPWETRVPVYMTRPIRVMGLSPDLLPVLVLMLYVLMPVFGEAEGLLLSAILTIVLQKILNKIGLPDGAVAYALSLLAGHPFMVRHMKWYAQAINAMWMRSGAAPCLPRGESWKR